MKLILAVAAALAASACSRTKHSSSRVDAVTYAENVKPLLDSRCAGCHADGQLAFPLTSYDAVRGKQSAVVAAVTAKRMPVWLAAAGHEAYHDDPSLSADEIAVFQKWADGGYLRGGEAANAPAAGALLRDLDADLVLPLFAPGTSFTPPHGERNDEYRCFILDWPFAAGERKFITGLEAVPGNRQIVHHLVAYHATADVAPMLRALDAEEDGLGYTCFGGAFPDRMRDPDVRKRMLAQFPDAAKDDKNQDLWLGHWAPGMRGNELPEGTGIAVDGGGALIVQVHYYSGNAPGEADSGGELRLKIADKVEVPGFVLQLSKGEWLSSKQNRSLVIAPQSEATVTYGVNLRQIAAQGQWATGDERPVERLTIHSANLHMHSYGKSAQAFLTSGGEQQTLLEIPRWDLRWQRAYTFLTPKTFEAKDFAQTSLSVQCTYANKTDHEVFGGFGSDEEMCFDFAFVTLNGKP